MFPFLLVVRRQKTPCNQASAQHIHTAVLVLQEVRVLLLVQHYVHRDQSSAFLGRGRNYLTYTETFKTLTLKNSARSAKFPSKGFENSHLQVV